MLVLGGFTYWAMQERKFAVEQKQLAEEQTKLAKEESERAENEKNKAISATERAEMERQNAERSAKEALWAKAQSDSARKYAVFLQILAEEQSIIAKQEAEKAKKEKERADKEKEIAEKEKERAELATDSANTLNYLTLARTLALKAQNSYEDPTINLLLAYQAYKFNKEYGGIERNPDIYNALRFSLEANKRSNVLEISEDLLISFIVSNRILLIHTINNDLIYYDVKNRDIQGNKNCLKQKFRSTPLIFCQRSIWLLDLKTELRYWSS
ncbi:MAG: hypothetical protein HC831_19875 [Chloroflexia bacterium]|nr:hypothetical protein [Chloroflexia bacterium]